MTLSRHLKINATVPEHLLEFLESYQKSHALPSRSAALSAAIHALQELELQRGYEELGEAQHSGMTTYPTLENTDGLDVEDSPKWR
jgi:Arc/MetJ-type ribon-helix-helix transcriptional regulator